MVIRLYYKPCYKIYYFCVENSSSAFLPWVMLPKQIKIDNIDYI